MNYETRAKARSASNQKQNEPKFDNTEQQANRTTNFKAKSLKQVQVKAFSKTLEELSSF